jgi:FkbM family methyltransferase
MLKSIVRRAFHGVGLELRRYKPTHSAAAQFLAMLTAHRVNLVFDVGANAGQFAARLRESGYRGRIVSFEPLSAEWTRLKNASRNDSLWQVAPRGAIGSEDGEIEIHIAGNSGSSSALNMLDLHRETAPDTAYIGTERVPLRRLDSIGQDYLTEDSIVLVKIDTQGFESQVLKGAPKIIGRAVGLSLEMSFVPLYEGETLFEQMFATIRALGFEVWDFKPAFIDRGSGRLLQADVAFFRPS